MNKKKIMIVVVIFVLIICLLIIIDRKFQITTFGYGKLDVENEYISLVCKYGPKEKNVIECKEDIEKCIKCINDLEVRQYDLLDQIIDSKTYKQDIYLGTRYVMILNKENGESNTFEFYVTGEENIWYDEKEYIIKGKVSDYLIELFK